MNIVITMAGLGSRFRKVGYNLPKYMIEAKGKTLLEWSLNSLVGFFDSNNHYFFIVQKKDNSSKFIKQICKKMDLPNTSIVEIEYTTKGQAETVMLAETYWNENEELLVYNIDTYIEENEMNSAQLKGDGFIPCFHASGDHWSFVKLNSSGEVIEIREKKRISDNCTVGAYYFKTAKLFSELYTELYIEQLHEEAGEQYIAPMYDLLLKKGGKIYISNIPEDKVHVLGTPEELEIFVHSNYKPNKFE